MSKRIQFFLGHLAISCLIALVFVLIVFLVWYPPPLAKAVGVTSIFLMLCGIDVIIGPLFTLLVYKEGKRNLKFDLIVIVAIQLSAFLYGFYSIAHGRPAWIVFNIDRFDLVRVVDIDERQLLKTKPEYQRPSYFLPRLVAAIKPENIKEKNQLDMESIISGVELSQRPNLYVPLDTQKASITKHLKNMDELKKFNKEADVAKLKKDYPQADSWLPLKGLVKDMVVLMNKENAQPVKIVDLRPWE